MKWYQYLTSKTVWGGIVAGGAKIAVAAFALAQGGALGEKASGIAVGVGIILGAMGVKSAIVKSGASQ